MLRKLHKDGTCNSLAPSSFSDLVVPTSDLSGSKLPRTMKYITIRRLGQVPIMYCFSWQFTQGLWPEQRLFCLYDEFQYLISYSRSYRVRFGKKKKEKMGASHRIA